MRAELHELLVNFICSQLAQVLYPIVPFKSTLLGGTLIVETIILPSGKNCYFNG